MRKLRLVSLDQIDDIRFADNHLKTAQQYLAQAGAKKARAAVARARKSVQGALRHALRAPSLTVGWRRKLQASVERTERKMRQ